MLVNESRKKDKERKRKKNSSEAKKGTGWNEKDKLDIPGCGQRKLVFSQGKKKYISKWWTSSKKQETQKNSAIKKR